MADSKVIEKLEEYTVALAAMTFVGDFTALLQLGIQLVMCTLGLSAFLVTPIERRKGRLPYVVLSFIIFALSATSPFLHAPSTFSSLYHSHPGASYARSLVQEGNQTFTFASQSLVNLYIAVGDGILLYRCYILWKDRPAVMIVPILAHLGFIGLTITAFTRHLQGVTLSSKRELILSQQTAITSIALSTSLNVITTSLIAYQIIVQQRALSKALPGRNIGIYTRAARVVVESALPLTLSGLGFVIVRTMDWFSGPTSGELPDLNVHALLASYIFGGLYTSFGALAPQMIIFRVTVARSHLQQEDLDSSINPDSEPLGDLEFDHGPGEDSESLGQDSHSTDLEGFVPAQGLDGEVQRDADSGDGVSTTLRNRARALDPPSRVSQEESAPDGHSGLASKPTVRVLSRRTASTDPLRTSKYMKKDILSPLDLTDNGITPGPRTPTTLHPYQPRYQPSYTKSSYTKPNHANRVSFARDEYLITASKFYDCSTAASHGPADVSDETTLATSS
ncbi:hypothetical protein CC1G_12025 [Coprinopsis cinerea okayama7|uniref:Uncharacterized protein n=1 Tax=Coprinopsis cinerea (strain Okayama-7 / 130 / ATCC MYA-4618 / FGSC 9003) TaxID=240176 RepID=A8P8G4_COPC7|nr:hypothetical protein CC1G_12025 [Coprinopsis cinerea okayama7\|eukprot:XP_001839562.2 hypothetical protein CC1G_12025 [Coprinopsis cinerea okayama7\